MHWSRYFRNPFEDGFREADEKEMALADVEPWLIKTHIGWLYRYWLEVLDCNTCYDGTLVLPLQQLNAHNLRLLSFPFLLNHPRRLPCHKTHGRPPRSSKWRHHTARSHNETACAPR